MIYPPLPWEIKHSEQERYNQNPNIMVPFSALCGGYLTYDSGEMMARYRLLTRHEYDHFNIRFLKKDSCIRYCTLITSLQDKCFKVNKARSV